MPRPELEPTGDRIVDALQRLQLAADRCEPQYRERLIRSGVAMTAVQEMIKGSYYIRASLVFETRVDGGDLGVIAQRRSGMSFMGRLARVSYFVSPEAERRAITMGFDEPEVFSLRADRGEFNGVTLQVPILDIEHCLRLDAPSPQRPWRR